MENFSFLFNEPVRFEVAFGDYTIQDLTTSVNRIHVTIQMILTTGGVVAQVAGVQNIAWK